VSYGNFFFYLCYFHYILFQIKYLSSYFVANGADPKSNLQKEMEALRIQQINTIKYLYYINTYIYIFHVSPTSPINLSNGTEASDQSRRIYT